jgi:hypothetical protein
MNQPYPEIQALEAILEKHSFTMEFLEDGFSFCAVSHRWVRFQLNGKNLVLMVDDEYKDFDLNKPAMNLCLFLRELEDYQEEDDILKWCNLKGLKASDSGVLEYYRGLASIYTQVENILGNMNPQISDFDFGLNAGVAQALRK